MIKQTNESWGKNYESKDGLGREYETHLGNWEGCYLETLQIPGKRSKYRKIIEVETTESVASARDIAQQSAFRRVANRSQHTVFRRDIVKTRL